MSSQSNSAASRCFSRTTLSSELPCLRLPGLTQGKADGGPASRSRALVLTVGRGARVGF